VPLIADDGVALLEVLPMRPLSLLVMLLALLLSACGGEQSACPEGEVECGDSCIQAPRSDAESIAVDVLMPSCGFGACHGGTYPEENLALSDADSLRALVGRPSAQDPSRNLVEAGDPAASYLVDKLRNRGITESDSLGNSATVMPPEQELCEARIVAVEAWIESGAE